MPRNILDNLGSDESNDKLNNCCDINDDLDLNIPSRSICEPPQKVIINYGGGGITETGSINAGNNITISGNRLDRLVGLGDLTISAIIPDLSIYATQQWVLNQNYITFGDIPTQVNSDWNSTSGVSQILNKPDLSIYLTDGNNISRLNNDSGYITMSDIPISQLLSFSTNTGTLSISSGNSISLDGRYSLIGHTHAISDIINLQNVLNSKVNTNLDITNSYGITIGGSLSTALSIGVDTTVLDNRYLRKSINDSNGTYQLQLGSLIVDTTTVLGGSVTLNGISQGSLTDRMLIIDPTTKVVKYINMPSFGGSFNISNGSGTNQFSVDSGDSLRFVGTGDTSIAFNADTKTITINSSGGSVGGGVDSFNARTGAVIPESGDYTTTLVSEGSNLYFTESRVKNTLLSDLPQPTNMPILDSDNILQALSKLQGQSSNKVNSNTVLSINGTSGRIVVSGGPQDLSENRDWIVDLQNNIVTAGTYPKVTVDSYGRVINGETLIESDIPSLNTSKITAGVFNTARLGTGTASGSTFLSGDGTWKSTPNTIYTGSNGINVSGTVISPNYGTTQNTIAQGNDSRINNGQTAYGWGDHRDPRYWREGYNYAQQVTVNQNVDADTIHPNGGFSFSYGTQSWASNLAINEYGGLLTFRGGSSSGDPRGRLQVQYGLGHTNESNSRLYFRTEYGTSGGNWRSWKRIWDSSSLRSNSENDTWNDNRYLSLSGGTLTGPLRIWDLLYFTRGEDLPLGGGYNIQIGGSGYSPYNRLYLGRPDGSTRIVSLGEFSMPTASVVRGTGSGIANTSFISFNEIDNITRQGYVGFNSASNPSFRIRNYIGGIEFLTADSSGTLGEGNVNIQGGLSVTGTATFVSLIGPTFTRTTQGLVPTPGGTGTTRYLREDGSWTVPAGGGTVTPTDLSLGTRNSTTLVINSSTGTNVTVPAVTTSLAGLMTAADKSKLNGLSSNAATATALQTARSIWGQSFNGTANVSGALSGATTITASSTIQSTGGDIIAYSSSDMRLKDFIKPFENPLGMIDKISGNTFTWNDNQDVYTGEDYGVIAQEVEAILPHAVTTRLNGYKAVRYEKLIPLLVEGIKALQKELNELKGGNNGVS